MCAKNSQCVEPATGLVKTLCDEVTREGLLELLDVLEGVVCTGVWHGSGFKPAVKYFRSPPQDTPALLAGDSDIIDLVAVNVGYLALVTTKLLELFNAANADDFLAVIADPQRKGCAPKTISRDSPIRRVLDPVGKSLLLNERRNPMRSRDVLKHLLLDVLDLNKP